jgi:hypothetical protein
MLAADKNNTTLSGPKMAQNGAMLPNVGQTFNDMSPTVGPTGHCCRKIGRHDIGQTQLSRPGLDWETSSIIHVELVDGDNMDVDLVRRGRRDNVW